MTNQHRNSATPSATRLSDGTGQRLGRRSFARLAPLAAAAALLGSACGSTSTTSSPADTSRAATDVSGPDTEDTDVRTVEIETPTTTAAPDVNDVSVEPTSGSGLVSPCGDFGPIPPVPDSMATQFFDTNGDGEPSFVTAYAGHGHPWTLRVVENGITSEALIPDVVNYAGIIGSVDAETREHVLVRDNDTGVVTTFATNDDGCVELVGTEPGPDPDPTGELVLTAPTIPVPTVPIQPVTIDPVIVAPAPPAPCGEFGPIPAASQITSDLTVDLVGDGVADDQVITYLDGVYKLRSIRGGVVSEVEVPDVGVSSIRALGVGDAGEISPGNEIVVRTGGGASSAEIGIFGHDATGCVVPFTLNGSVLEMYVGATIGTSSGMSCSDGVIAEWSYTLDDDGTYFGSSAAFHESTAGDFTYLPASDDFSEGLTADELLPAELDCFGFGL